MTDRERWIVYPLLFLAIGLALRNDVELQDELHNKHSAEVELVRCKTLEVTGPENKTTVKITTDSNGNGAVETGSSGGELQSKLGANQYGGSLEVLDDAGKIYVLVGHNAERTGMFAGNAETGLAVSLNSVVARPRPGEKDKEDGAAEKTAPEKTDGDKTPPEKTSPEKNSSGKAPDGKTQPRSEKSEPGAKQETTK
jgi:hypothetical protein